MFYITKLGSKNFLIGKEWMQKHGVVLDVANEKVLFYFHFCCHKGAAGTLPTGPWAEPKQVTILKRVSK